MLQNSLLKNYKHKPNHTAVVYNGSKYTYADLWISVIKMACWLDENVVSEARIGILLDNELYTQVKKFLLLNEYKVLGRNIMKSLFDLINKYSDFCFVVP